MTFEPIRRAAALGAAVVLGLGLAACGDDGSDDAAGESPSAARTAPNGDVYNAADVEFATQMIPHHAQAVQMVTIAQGRPVDPEVAQLMAAIREAQVPEVETMTDWLTAWGEEVPETSLDHANAGHGTEVPSTGHDHDMPGMMSAEEMQELADAPDGEFQELWLEMMVEHHEGAVDMAETELEEGEFADALTLAEGIVAAQEAEIEQMEAMLGR